MPASAQLEPLPGILTIPSGIYMYRDTYLAPRLDADALKFHQQVCGSSMLGSGLMMVPRPSALIQSEESVPATEDHCQAAQLSPGLLEYLTVINFIRKCERQRGNQILVC